jgi:hypothetical protein
LAKKFSALARLLTGRLARSASPPPLARMGVRR